MDRRRTSAMMLMTAALALSLATAACDEPRSKTKTTGTTAPTPTVAASSAPQPAKPKSIEQIELLVDSMGPYLGGKRVDLAANDGRDRLAAVVKELPINASPVTLIADKRAKTPHVAAVVTELGKAGAPKVTLKTD